MQTFANVFLERRRQIIRTHSALIGNVAALQSLVQMRADVLHRFAHERRIFQPLTMIFHKHGKIRRLCNQKFYYFFGLIRFVNVLNVGVGEVVRLAFHKPALYGIPRGKSYAAHRKIFDLAQIVVAHSPHNQRISNKILHIAFKPLQIPVFYTSIKRNLAAVRSVRNSAFALFEPRILNAFWQKAHVELCVFFVCHIKIISYFLYFTTDF